MRVRDTVVQNASSYSIRQLREATNYVVRVAAISAAGMGRHANARFTTPRLQQVHAVTDGLSHFSAVFPSGGVSVCAKQ